MLESLAPGRPYVLVTASGSAKLRGDFYCVAIIVYGSFAQKSKPKPPLTVAGRDSLVSPSLTPQRPLGPRRAGPAWEPGAYEQESGAPGVGSAGRVSLI